MQKLYESKIGVNGIDNKNNPNKIVLFYCFLKISRFWRLFRMENY